MNIQNVSSNSVTQIFLILLLVAMVIDIIACWKINEKAGEPGYAAIVPLYSQYIRYEITWGNGWIFIIPMVLSTFAAQRVQVGPLTDDSKLKATVAVIALIAEFIIMVITEIKLAKAFGKSDWFAVGLVFLPLIFTCILAFGKDEYKDVPSFKSKHLNW